MNEQHKENYALAQTLYANARSVTDEPYSEQEASRWQLMIAIWERMGQFFGQQWERSYGTVEDQTISAWMGALNRFSKDEVESALRAVERDFSGAFPPTFPEFRELCETARRYAKTRHAHQQAEASADRPLMEHLKASATTETGRKAIAEIQKSGRNGFPETKKESYLTLGLQRRWGMPPEHWK